MKILITGGNSGLSRALMPVLSGSCELVTAGRTDCDIVMDLLDLSERIPFPDDVDAVIHTAAHFGGLEPEAILAAESVNMLGSLKLCAEAHRSRARHFVLISSIFSSLNERSPQYGIYALSKRHAEEAVTFFCSSVSMPLTILRPSQIYGAKNSRAHQPFFYAILDKASCGEDVTLYGSNDPIRNYIHVDDVAAVIAEVVHRQMLGSFPCLHTQDTTYAQIAEVAFAAFGKGGKVIFAKDKPDIPDITFPKDHRLYESIGYYPKVSIADGVYMIARSMGADR